LVQIWIFTNFFSFSFILCFVVLQLCYNQLTGSIPTKLGDLKKLSVLALQSNKLAGAIPASLGDLGMLMRLDLSSNNLFGSIPTKLAEAPFLQVLDVHNNTLSGNVPPGNKFVTYLTASIYFFHKCLAKLLSRSYLMSK
jgi:Leucine-rich repeat (LRR) protein